MTANELVLVRNRDRKILGSKHSLEALVIFNISLTTHLWKRRIRTKTLGTKNIRPSVSSPILDEQVNLALFIFAWCQVTTLGFLFDLFFFCLSFAFFLSFFAPFSFFGRTKQQQQQPQHPFPEPRSGWEGKNFCRKNRFEPFVVKEGRSVDNDDHLDGRFRREVNDVVVAIVDNDDNDPDNAIQADQVKVWQPRWVESDRGQEDISGEMAEARG